LYGTAICKKYPLVQDEHKPQQPRIHNLMFAGLCATQSYRVYVCGRASKPHLPSPPKRVVTLTRTPIPNPDAPPDASPCRGDRAARCVSRRARLGVPREPTRRRPRGLPAPRRRGARRGRGEHRARRRLEPRLPGARGAEAEPHTQSLQSQETQVGRLEEPAQQSFGAKSILK